MPDNDFVPPLADTSDAHPEPTTLSLAGDLEDADAIREALRVASGNYSRSLGVDLTAVTFVPSEVIAVLFASQRAAEKARTTIVIAVAAGSIAHTVARITTLPHIVV